jgi:hypothetical protein
VSTRVMDAVLISLDDADMNNLFNHFVVRPRFRVWVLCASVAATVGFSNSFWRSTCHLTTSLKSVESVTCSSVPVNKKW